MHGSIPAIIHFPQDKVVGCGVLSWGKGVTKVEITTLYMYLWKDPITWLSSYVSGKFAPFETTITQ